MSKITKRRTWRNIQGLWSTTIFWHRLTQHPVTGLWCCIIPTMINATVLASLGMPWGALGCLGMLSHVLHPLFASEAIQTHLHHLDALKLQRVYSQTQSLQRKRLFPYIWDNNLWKLQCQPYNKCTIYKPLSTLTKFHMDNYTVLQSCYYFESKFSSTLLIECKSSFSCLFSSPQWVLVYGSRIDLHHCNGSGLEEDNNNVGVL